MTTIASIKVEPDLFPESDSPSSASSLGNKPVSRIESATKALKALAAKVQNKACEIFSSVKQTFTSAKTLAFESANKSFTAAQTQINALYTRLLTFLVYNPNCG